MSTHPISDEQIWSWIDRGAPELQAHLARCPEDAERVAGIRAAVTGAAASPGPRRLPPRIGRYVPIRLLGEGGMGLVYEAEQEDPRRRVALKLIRASWNADERRVALFRREARALALLAHPGIAAIYEAGRTEEGEHFFAMELVDGLALNRYVSEVVLPRRARIELFCRVCEAVHHAHQKGVIHRDLKPSNVLVDREGNPKVLDFGLARITEAVLSLSGPATATGELMGTLPYMSPEQARGLSSRVDAPSDVYSLGVMLYELLTGALPHRLEGVSLPEAARAICEDPPHPPSKLDRSLRGELETIVLKALEKEPAARYPSAEELAQDLRRYLAGQSIHAVRPGLGRRALKFYLRNKLSATLAILVLLLGTLVAYAALFLRTIPWEMTGDWWAEGAPYDELRWRGNVPEVLLGDRWYELLAIDDLHAGYIVGFCQQHADRHWRKRFSEDLIQVLNRMRDWCFWDVDLELRDLATGEIVRLRDVPLDEGRRRVIYRRRDEWPFERFWREGAELHVVYQGKPWILESLEGVPAHLLIQGTGTPDMHGTQASDKDAYIAWASRFWLSNCYDTITDLTGRSPGDSIRMVLRDPETGEVSELTDVQRTRTRVIRTEPAALAELRTR